MSGLWPWFHLSSFEAFTGPKIDDWLVRMVGLLAAVIGASLATAALRRQLSAPVLVLALGSATAFAAVDVVYVAAGRISAIYLADAAAELALGAAIGLSVLASGGQRGAGGRGG